MRVSVAFVPRGSPPQQVVELPEGSTAEALVRALDQHPDLVIVVRGEEPIPLDAPLRDGDDLKLVHVVSGGS